MRIVAGSARGRRIVAPAGSETRPTSDRVREALFNALGSLGLIEGAVVVDLFAGSGALGLEALSRGATHVTFVERDRRALGVIRSNLDNLGFADRATLVHRDVTAFLPTAGPFDVALCDPPYSFDAWPELLATCGSQVVVAESDRALGPLHGWEMIRQKEYGTTVVTILSVTPPDHSE